MQTLALDALLAFVLAVPVVMKYRILPVAGTPYWLFALLFFILVANVLVSLYPGLFGKKLPVEKLKSVLLWSTLAIVVGGTSMTAIIDRSKTAPVYGVHDIILQQESALRYLLEGKNPYKETYFGTPLEEWHYDELGKPAVNPALYHFVMPPWYLLFSFLFYGISIPLLGFFDGRMPLVFCLFGTLFIISRWFKERKIANITLLLVALSPAVIDYFIEGRSDIFALFWFVWALYLLEKKKFLLSAGIFALAVLSKQTIWFAAPFYGVYVWITGKKSTSTVFKSLLVVLAVVALIAGPFILWNARAFTDSVVFYLSGNTPQSYPVSGYGLGMLLYELGVIRDIHAYYPFTLWQLGLGLPAMGIGLWWLAKKPVMSRLILGYGVTLLVIWYVSRYLNNSHLGYVSTILILAVLKDWDEKISV